MPTMTKAIYSASERCRLQFYDDGAVVGFTHPSQTKALAKERVEKHLAERVNPHVFVVNTPQETEADLAAVQDWVTLYEKEA